MHTALIIVDFQKDFQAGGPLGHPDSDSIVGAILGHAKKADIVIASRDLHPGNHFSFVKEPEFKDGSWPGHCVQGTSGAEIDRRIRKIADYTVSKGMRPEPPDDYSAFAGGTLRPTVSTETILRENYIRRVVVAGLLLGWCVSQTAFDANALGFETLVPRNSTLALPGDDPALHFTALERAGILCS